MPLSCFRCGAWPCVCADGCSILNGDCLNVLRALPDESVHCCVTSPPYWGLRDYGTVTWEGGDAACDHVDDPSKTKKFGNEAFNENRPSRESTKVDGYYFKDVCRKCGAKRIDSQIGLEATPDEYVAKMVEVFREVRRVLRDDGTVFLNLGDTYASSGGAHGGRSDNQRGVGAKRTHESGGGDQDARYAPAGLKPKDLVGIPWMVAFALRADGWYLRSEIIWHKPAPMPESVTDRPTKSHEQIFLLAKSARYFYDYEAVKEESSGVSGGASFGKQGQDAAGTMAQSRTYDRPEYSYRNRRSVWTVTTQPYPGAHFATFPPALIMPCIMAGTSEEGCCQKCGAPWERVIEKTDVPDKSAKGSRFDVGKTGARDGGDRTQAGERFTNQTVGWKPGCDCGGALVPCVILDPFGGSGTTLAVSRELGRRGLIIELNEKYCTLAVERIASQGNWLWDTKEDDTPCHETESPECSLLF